MKRALLTIFFLLLSELVFAQTLPTDVMTPITLAQTQTLFNEAIKNPKIRMMDPNGGTEAGGGKCGERANTFDDWLFIDLGITSGQLVIKCESQAIELTDRSTGKIYRYAGYHVANVLLVKRDLETSLYVLDMQFSDGPMSLEQYLETNVTKKDGTCSWVLTSEKITSLETKL